jgi:hypothetical protein
MSHNTILPYMRSGKGTRAARRLLGELLNPQAAKTYARPVLQKVCLVAPPWLSCESIADLTSGSRTRRSGFHQGSSLSRRGLYRSVDYGRLTMFANRGYGKRVAVSVMMTLIYSIPIRSTKDPAVRKISHIVDRFFKNVAPVGLHLLVSDTWLFVLRRKELLRHVPQRLSLFEARPALVSPSWLEAIWRACSSRGFRHVCRPLRKSPC